MLSRIGLYADIDIPGIIAGGFQFPSRFCHKAAAAHVRFTDGCGESCCRDSTPVFSVEFIVPGQAQVEVMPAASVVQTGTDAENIAVYAVQGIVHAAGGEGAAAQVGVEVLAVEVQVPGGPGCAAAAGGRNFMGKVKHMAHSDVAAPLADVGIVVIGIPIGIMKYVICIIFHPTKAQGSFYVGLAGVLVSGKDSAAAVAGIPASGEAGA